MVQESSLWATTLQNYHIGILRNNAYLYISDLAQIKVQN